MRRFIARAVNWSSSTCVFTIFLRRVSAVTICLPAADIFALYARAVGGFAFFARGVGGFAFFARGVGGFALFARTVSRCLPPGAGQMSSACLKDLVGLEPGRAFIQGQFLAQDA